MRLTARLTPLGGCGYQPFHPYLPNELDHPYWFN